MKATRVVRRLHPILGALVVGATLLSSSTAFAGAWTREPFHFYLQLGTAFSTADNAYGADGSSGPIYVRTGKNDTNPNVSNFQQLLTDVYFEVGLLDRLTLIGDIGYSSSRQKNPGGDINYQQNSFADTMLGLRLGVVKDPAIAIETRLTLPTGRSVASLPSGTGDLRGEMRIAVGKSFSFLPIYADAEFGFVLRGSGTVADLTVTSGKAIVNFAPELVLHLELGAALVRWQYVTRLLLTVALDYKGSTTKADAGSLGSALLSLVPENSELTSLSAALMWYVYHGLGVQVRFTQIVEGYRIPKISTVGAALFVDY